MDFYSPRPSTLQLGDVKNQTQSLKLSVRSTAISTLGITHPRSASQPAALVESTPAFTTYEWSQSTTNNFDILQGALPELNLRSEGLHIAQRGRWNNKTSNTLVKPTNRGLNKIHMASNATTRN